MFNAQLFRRARLAAGLTLRTVGDAAQLDPSAICHYEAQRAQPSPRATSRWADALVALLQDRSTTIADVLSHLE